MTYVLKINGTELPTPDENGVEITEQDLQVNSYRDMAGKLHKRTVRWGLRRLDVSWSRLTAEQVNLIRSLTKGKEYFSLTYYSSDEKSGTISECYSGDLKYGLKKIVKDKNGRDRAIYESANIAIIER